MKHFRETLSRYAPWLLLLLCVDLFSSLLLWLSDVRAFWTLSCIILLWSLILFTAILLTVSLKERKRQRLFQNFLSDPDAVNEANLLRAVSRQEQEQLRYLSSTLRNLLTQHRQLTEDLKDYEEYVESWAHEAKTPLSLLTMLLDNRGDELPPQLQAKLDYVRSQLQEDVTQMLYYARLKSSTKDYRLENVSLSASLEEVLEDHAPLLEEKGFVIENQLDDETVFTDRRGLQFMLGQIISNAIKYSSGTPKLSISIRHTDHEDILTIADNGVGMKPYDLPYIFQKGFTGGSTDRQKKATGMGLYLTKKMADDLNLKLDAASEWSKGFSISIFFPNVHAN